MTREYETKILNINVSEIIDKLRSLGAKQKHPETLMRRWVFDLDSDDPEWIRLRDNGENVSLTYNMIFPPVYFHWWCSHLFDWKNHGRKTALSEASMPLVLSPQAITSGGRFFLTLCIARLWSVLFEELRFHSI